MSARLTWSASLAARPQPRSSLRRRVRRGPVPPLAAPRHSALQPSFLTLFLPPALLLSQGQEAGTRSLAARGSWGPLSFLFSSSSPALQMAGLGCRAGRTSRAGKGGRSGCPPTHTPLSARFCPAAPGRRTRLDSSSLGLWAILLFSPGPRARTWGTARDPWTPLVSPPGYWRLKCCPPAILAHHTARVPFPHHQPPLWRPNFHLLVIIPAS